MTRVISMATAPRGWEDDSSFVYIGRAGHGMRGPWGNPFTEGTRDEKLSKYEVWMRQRLVTSASLRAQVADLYGKTLVCFCKPHACHGDVLARFVDQEFFARLSRRLPGFAVTTLDPRD